MPLGGLRDHRRREDTSQDAGDVRVDERRTLLVGERRHRSSGVGTDAGQGPERDWISGQLPFGCFSAAGDLDCQLM